MAGASVAALGRAIEALIGRAYEARTPKTLTRLDTCSPISKLRAAAGRLRSRRTHAWHLCRWCRTHDPLERRRHLGARPHQRFANRQALIAEHLVATKKVLESHMNSAAAYHRR
jgi:hypothetical protein